MSHEITTEAENVQRGDILNGAGVKEVYRNGEEIAITTSAGVERYFVGEMVTVERVS